jgi:DNA-binding LacI/PurR family transcriptional regulator
MVSEISSQSTPRRRRVTIRDVAEAAAVSQSTASRALNGNGYVAPAVRIRIQEAASALEYVPNATARHLRRKVSHTLGLVVSDLTNPFYAELAAGATEQARRHGYTTMLINSGPPPTADSVSVREFAELEVAGVILTPSSADVGNFLRRQQIPTVEVDRQFADGIVDGVVIDNTAAALRITALLTELGHRRIALLIDETRWATGRDRYNGYRMALENAGLPLDPALVVVSGWDASAATAAARRLLAESPSPTAIFAANNILAEGVWRAAGLLDLGIPDGLSLVAFDDVPWMSLVRPGVTVVAQDVVAQGRTAVDVLLARLREPAGAVRTVVVPYQLIRRGSCGPPYDRLT